MRRRGSVMLETVLVLPVFVFFVFFIIQAALVLTARQMTVYAAYCAARAALVYNPGDYSASDSGVAHKAACMVLGWISFSDTGTKPIQIPSIYGTYDVPCSDNIAKQVRVSVSEYAGDCPSVTATVDFKYPLVIPFGSIVFAYNPKPNGWDSGPAESGLIASGDAVEDGSRQYLYIRESYTLAKPYKTETFPLAAEGDKVYLGIESQVLPPPVEDPPIENVPMPEPIFDPIPYMPPVYPVVLPGKVLPEYPIKTIQPAPVRPISIERQVGN